MTWTFVTQDTWCSSCCSTTHSSVLRAAPHLQLDSPRVYFSAKSEVFLSSLQLTQQSHFTADFSQVPSQSDQCIAVGAFHVCLRFYSGQCLLLWQTPERKDLTGRRVPVAPFPRSQPWLTSSAALIPPPALNLMLGRHSAQVKPGAT